jgi:deoxyribodipyrimidine photolyase-like uncharacterized protein
MDQDEAREAARTLARAERAKLAPHIANSRTQIAPSAKAIEAAMDNAYAQSIPAMAEIVG